ncbi:MFS transporter [Kitasatospora sp. NPDC049258]|uniref:MFS transporter n=1 Tax=Kitasatospora sp. NPDC049258 TaxID=3155394 RepID=UPI003443714F
MRACEEVRRATAFAIVWAGQLGSVLLSSVASFVLALSVFEETGSAWYLSLITAGGLLGGIYLAPIAGAVADRFDRRAFLVGSNLVLAAVSLTIARAVGDRPGAAIGAVVALTFLAATVSAAMSAALTAAVRELRPERDLTRVNGMIALVENAPVLAAPALGALAFAVADASVVYLLDAASFAACSLAVLTARWTPAARVPRHPNPFAAAGAGIAFIWRDRGLRTLQLGFAGVNFCNGLAVSSVTAFVLSGSAPGHGPWNLAGTSTASAAGLVLGAAAVLGFGARVGRGTLVGAGVVAAGLFGRIGLALTGLPALWFLAVGLRNAAVQLSAAPATAVWQERTPAGVQAGVHGARKLLGQGSYPLAVLLGGWAGAQPGVGPGAILLLGGLGEVAIGAALLRSAAVRVALAGPVERNAAVGEVRAVRAVDLRGSAAGRGGRGGRPPRSAEPAPGATGAELPAPGAGRSGGAPVGPVRLVAPGPVAERGPQRADGQQHGHRG